MAASYSELLAGFERAVVEEDAIEGCKYGYDLMNQYWHKLDNERGDELKEKLLFFAHRIGDSDWTKALWKHLDQKHPGSKRVDRLGVLALTTQIPDKDSLKAAITLMENSIQADPANTASRRVLLALMLTQVESNDQKLKLLDEYLRDFPSDVAVWRELGDFARQHNRMREAQLAYEELALVLDRDNIHNWLILAGLCCQGGNFLAGFKYYCMAVVYEPFCLQALQGLVEAYMTMLDRKEKCFEAKVEEALPLAKLASKRICDLIEEKTWNAHSEETKTQKDLEKYVALYDRLVAL